MTKATRMRLAALHGGAVLALVLDGAGCGGMQSAPVADAGPDGGFVHPSVTTCKACHAGQAPTSTAGWRSASYTTSPFDYGTNGLGIVHGGGQDCSVCHAGPGAGGQPPSWVGAEFAHVPFSLAETTCVACHLSQRPDLQPGESAATAASRVGFDHAAQGTVDCIGCHSATVDRDRYVDYWNPATFALPGGDWAGGQSYPGSMPVGFPDEHLELQTTTLGLSPANDRVTSATVAFEDLRELMIHTSIAVPAELAPGPPASPDYGKCWHCHPSRDGIVTRFPAGKFHPALAQYTATPTAPVTPLPQPVQGCQECHTATRPAGIVSRSSLQPMNHGITFASPAIVARVTVTGVQDMDCSACHHDPTGIFADGEFHPNTAGVVLRDCVSCHYLTMADDGTADIQNGTAYRMRHASAQVTFHTCTTCHPSAVANLAGSTLAAESWKPGRYHAVLATQPTACNDCHAVSIPPATSTTFDHGSAVDGGSGRDCSDCHAFPGTGSLTAPNWLGATGP